MCTHAHACSGATRARGAAEPRICASETRCKAKPPPILPRRLEKLWPGSSLKMCL